MDSLNMLLLQLFGDDVSVVCGPDGEPVALRVTIRLNKNTKGLHEALKIAAADAEDYNEAG